MNETKNNVERLKKQGYFDNWKITVLKPIIFHLFPNIEVSEDWLNKRVAAYTNNAKKLGAGTPPLNFYVYPSKEAGEPLGIVPAIAFPMGREIHGHIKQSPGHEVTHILLSQVNSRRNLGNGVWNEGVCTFLDGTGTDRRKHALSMHYPEAVFATPWSKWKTNLPETLYPLAASIFQYFDEQFGFDSIVKFLSSLRKDDAGDRMAIRQAFGAPSDKLHEQWRLWLTQF